MSIFFEFFSAKIKNFQHFFINFFEKYQNTPLPPLSLSFILLRSTPRPLQHSSHLYLIIFLLFSTSSRNSPFSLPCDATKTMILPFQTTIPPSSSYPSPPQPEENSRNPNPNPSSCPPPDLLNWT